MFGSTAGAPSSLGGGGGFGTPLTPAFTGSSLFTTPFSAQSRFQQSPFFLPAAANYASTSASGASDYAAAAAVIWRGQLTTQMAPVAPLPFSLADRDIQAILDAYKEDTANPMYAFKHLLFSVTDPQFRAKPAAVSDMMWAGALGKLEGTDSADRERLWPQLVQGFKDLSNRLKMQRLKTTLSNVKRLQRHFQADTLPRIQRMRQKEQNLQRRLLRVMRIVEALEGKGCRLPLVKGEAQLADKLTIITKQLKGSGAELSRSIQSLLAISRSQVNGGVAGSLYLPGSTKIDGQSLSDLQELLQQQTEAIAGLGNVLKRDIRDMEIMMAEDTEMTADAS